MKICQTHICVWTCCVCVQIYVLFTGWWFMWNRHRRKLLVGAHHNTSGDQCLCWGEAHLDKPHTVVPQEVLLSCVFLMALWVPACQLAGPTGLSLAPDGQCRCCRGFSLSVEEEAARPHPKEDEEAPGREALQGEGASGWVWLRLCAAAWEAALPGGAEPRWAVCLKQAFLLADSPA